jgi:hypothetical protein
MVSQSHESSHKALHISAVSLAYVCSALGRWVQVPKSTKHNSGKSLKNYEFKQKLGG